LQPINAQLSTNSNPLKTAGKPPIKSEHTYSTPYDSPHLQPATATTQMRSTTPVGANNIPIKNEHGSTTPSQTRRVQEVSPAGQAFGQYCKLRYAFRVILLLHYPHGLFTC
jgi:hypothetical protein